MAGLKGAWATARSSLSELVYRLVNLTTGKTPVHVVVCGPDDDTAQFLFDTVPTVFTPQDVTTVRGAAVDARGIRARVIVSWDKDDASRSDRIMDALASTRAVIFVLATCDPRHLVAERSPVLSHHFTQGADYRLHVDGKTRAMTKPGVVPRSRDAIEVIDRLGSRTFVARREELLEHPWQVINSITSLVSKHGGPTAKTTKSDSEQLIPPVSDPNASRPDQASRVAQQRARFPELDTVAHSLGYQDLPATTPPAVVSSRGLVVAFHTPDEVYRAEAERLRKSLETLGLDYEISVVEPEANWVRTTLLKPTWIAPVREKHSGPLLYVDVDAFVHADPWPYVEDMEADMAAVVYGNGQLNSATLWINDTPGASLILSRWAEGAGARRDADSGDLAHTGDNGDQGVLKLVVEAEEAKDNPAFSFGRLPPNLATIFDRTHEYRFGPVVIEQLQVSREVTQRSKRLSRRRDRLRELSE